MMDYPFYRNYYYPAREVPVPVRRETKPERKVIHVPVMDGSEKRSRRNRVDSAVMIQKVLRGFLVRKSVKKIAAIKAEVDEMENRIMSEESMELIRNDKKEKLKVNEMLMRLLLKLDSVPGVDFGVRDCRKSVIKKAIRLQEMVDSIPDHQTLDRKGTVSESDRSSNSNSLANAVDLKVELQNNVESQNNSEFEARGIPEAIDVESRANVELNVEEEEEEEEEAEPEIEGNIVKSASASSSELNLNSLDVNEKLESQNNVESESEARDIPEAVDIEGNVAKSASESNSNSNSPDRNRESHGNEEAAKEFTENMEQSEDESQTGSSADPDQNLMMEGSDFETSEKHENGEAKEGSDGKNVQLLEKLVEENEKMMGLMAGLFKKNEMQTQLLSSLSHRVEHLERALMCEIFRRKKKKKRNETCS